MRARLRRNLPERLDIWFDIWWNCNRGSAAFSVERAKYIFIRFWSKMNDSVGAVAEPPPVVLHDVTGRWSVEMKGPLYEYYSSEIAIGSSIRMRRPGSSVWRITVIGLSIPIA